MQLRRLTTLRTGGTPARYFRPAEAAELRAALAQCRQRGLPWRTLGGGSNLLVEEGRLPCAVIHVSAPGFDCIERAEPGLLQAGAGVSVARLLAYCREAGLGGMEFLSGMPGTVGGAVAGNAGAWGRRVSDALKRLHLVLPDGEQVRVARDRLAFSYRRCELGAAVITAAEFELEPREPALIARSMAQHARTRAARQPLGLPSAGCIFKNPPHAPAGRLLDACGMKGRRAGGAAVSERHANFIVNRANATARDVLELIGQMQRAVRSRFGIQLELEVRHWPAQSRAA